MLSLNESSHNFSTLFLYVPTHSVCLHFHCISTSFQCHAFAALTYSSSHLADTYHVYTFHRHRPATLHRYLSALCPGHAVTYHIVTWHILEPHYFADTMVSISLATLDHARAMSCDATTGHFCANALLFRAGAQLHLAHTQLDYAHTGRLVTFPVHLRAPSCLSSTGHCCAKTMRVKSLP